VVHKLGNSPTGGGPSNVDYLVVAGGGGGGGCKVEVEELEDLEQLFQVQVVTQVLFQLQYKHIQLQ
jgi:hypothetical protein